MGMTRRTYLMRVVSEWSRESLHTFAGQNWRYRFWSLVTTFW